MAQPVFRTIEVGTDQHITLGEPITPDVRALMDPAPPGSVKLRMRTGTFGQAASITVDLSPTDMNVQQIEFTYDPGTDYDALVAAYTEELGQPNETGTVADSEQSSVWKDTITLFQLWSRGATVGSLLKDLLGA